MLGSSKAPRVAVKLVAATAITAALTLVSQAVVASLTATAKNTTPQSISTATLKLIMEASERPGLSAGFSTPITATAPGDVMNRFIDLSNVGSLAGQSPTLQAQDIPSTTLTTDPINGLQVTVLECSRNFTPNSGDCSGTLTTALTPTPVNALTTAPRALTLSSLAPGSTVHLKLSLSLPAGSETTTNGVLPGGSVQGLTSTLTWTFSESARAATNSNA